MSTEKAARSLNDRLKEAEAALRNEHFWEALHLSGQTVLAGCSASDEQLVRLADLRTNAWNCLAFADPDRFRSAKGDALRDAEQFAAVYARLSHIEVQVPAEALHNLGGLFKSAGQAERAIDCFNMALALHDGSAQQGNRADLLCCIADLSLSIGDFDAAFRCATEALAICGQSAMRGLVWVECSCLRAKILMAKGERQAAMESMMALRDQLANGVDTVMAGEYAAYVADLLETWHPSDGNDPATRDPEPGVPDAQPGGEEPE